MTDATEQTPPGPPIAGDEVATLVGSLDRQRWIFAWKCGGLDAAGLSATLSPSTMTLGGLMKHLALVEDEYFSVRLLGGEARPPWNAIDWDADPDWEWSSAADDSPEELMALWQGAVDRSRAATAQALADGGPGRARALEEPERRITQPATDPHRPDRGVLAARGTRRPHPRVRRRPHRRGPAELGVWAATSRDLAAWAPCPAHARCHSM